MFDIGIVQIKRMKKSEAFGDRYCSCHSDSWFLLSRGLKFAFQYYLKILWINLIFQNHPWCLIIYSEHILNHTKIYFLILIPPLWLKYLHPFWFALSYFYFLRRGVEAKASLILLIRFWNTMHNIRQHPLIFLTRW